MKSAIIALIQLATRLLDWLEKRERKANDRQRQKERDRAESDPAAYLRDEFGGVPDKSNDTTKADKTDDR